LAIGDDDFVTSTQCLFEPIAAIGRVLDLIAILPQSFGEILGRLQVVFDQQEWHEEEAVSG
jgi:hypothetical protein